MNDAGQIHFHQPEDNTLLIRLSGNWTIGEELPAPGEAARRIESAGAVAHIRFDTQELSAWDSGLLTFLIALLKGSADKGVDIDRGGLPEGVQRLIALATAVPKKEDARKTVEYEPFLSRVGDEFLDFIRSAGELIGFVGEAVVATGRLLIGKASFRANDLGIFLQESGAQALSIVTLISLLVGLILAFVGILQLKIFGAQVFVADLVGIAMVRAMGAVMTGIIMAGRTGAAYAAQLGTMQVNEEIDALQTLGINPMEFLVLPRMLALTAMMPLLCLYADLMGVLGGWVVAVPMYGLSSVQYFQRSVAAVNLADFFIGLFTSFVFGVLVALSGCLRGMQCGRSASAVGDAATSAVVTGIVAIIISMALITVLCDVIGI
jgi:phospholipid/cholesterol/gamma-HCH transport system permease protein